ncbi:MAG TPA: protein-L-isoaspartate O-methyltransferase [Sedimenticola sp.]|nr:protein-L-isoaspartate O-methyltransferase [Sedimenticola sp.]
MAENNIEQARFNMVQQQIRPWEVLDQQVLSTLTGVPREDFVPDGYRNVAFADIEIPLGHGEHMMKPVIEARMLQALAVRPTDKVLEIGTGSGFITACLASLGGYVTSLDIHADFTAQAHARLEKLGLRNVTVKTADALAIPSDNRSFDVIAVTGSVPDPKAVELLQNQLNIGGRLFVIVGEAPVMEACLITRVGDNQWRREMLFETEIAPLVNVAAPEPFTF